MHQFPMTFGFIQSMSLGLLCAGLRLKSKVIVLKHWQLREFIVKHRQLTSLYISLAIAKLMTWQPVDVSVKFFYGGVYIVDRVE